MHDVEAWLEDRIILKVYKGSHAHGTSHADSDIDIGGVCVPPRDYLYGLYAFEQYETDKYTQYPDYNKKQQPADTVIFGLHKFVKLALACNPNIIETLYSDAAHIICCNRLGRILLDQRHLFLTKKARHTFGGYALAQLKRLNNKMPLNESKKRLAKLDASKSSLEVRSVRLEHRINRLFGQEQLSAAEVNEVLSLRSEQTGIKSRLEAIEAEQQAITRAMGAGKHDHHGSHAGLIERYGYDVKHAMHLIRLLNMGLEILTEGDCNVLRPENNYLMAIRHGEYTLAHVRQEAEKLFSQLDEAHAKSSLPDEPDQCWVNQLLLDLSEASLDRSYWEK